MVLVHCPGCCRILRWQCCVDKSYLWQIYFESARPTVARIPTTLPSRREHHNHASPDTAPHATPTRLTGFPLRTLALRRAHRRTARPGVPRARTRRARRRGRGTPRERRRAARAQRIVGHVQRGLRELALRHEHERAHGRMARGKQGVPIQWLLFFFTPFFVIHALVITGTNGSVVHPREAASRCVPLYLIY